MTTGKKPSIIEVAARAGVAPATVSRVLNHTAPVSRRLRERVLKAVEELNYRPNVFARGLVTNRSQTIGVLVTDTDSPFYGPMLRGIDDVLDNYELQMLVASGRRDRERENRLVSMLNARVDGFILYSEGMSDDDLRQLSRTGIPVVVVGRLVPGMEENSVYLDNQYGGYLATQYLLERGHREIAHITGPLSTRDGIDRLRGYRQALEEAQIPYQHNLVLEGDFTEERGWEVTMELLRSKSRKFTAIFAGDDLTAIGTLAALRDWGLKVPQDMSVVGYDDIYLARYLYPPLTTIRQPVYEMGRSAADILLGNLEGRDTSKIPRRFLPTLIERESVASIS